MSALARAGLRNAGRVKVGVPAVAATAEARPRVTPASLSLSAATVAVSDKPAALAAFLLARAADRVIVYFATVAAVDFYAAALPLGGCRCGCRQTGGWWRRGSSLRPGTRWAWV